MEIQYSPKTDANLEAAFMTESCLSTAASCIAERNGCKEISQERRLQADNAAALLFLARYPEMEKRSVLSLLKEMIDYETYKASELFVLFAKEAQHDGAEETAKLFEEEARLADKHRQRLEELYVSLFGET